MALAVPFGQFVPGNTAVHRLDARIKLLMVVVYVFALFACSGWAGLLVCTALLITVYAIADINAKLALRGLKPVWLILAFTFLANSLTFQAGADTAVVTDVVTDAIVIIGNFGFKPLGALQGLYFVLRITLLVSMTSLLTYTSSVISLADAITSLLGPLRHLRVPVEDIAMMFTIALRFIPLTAEEAEKLIVAQTARGAHFDQGGPIKRIRAYVPVMIPLFVNLFRRADQLAQAMETRCYQGKGRTQMNHARLVASDILTAVIGSVLLVAIGIFL